MLYRLMGWSKASNRSVRGIASRSNSSAVQRERPARIERRNLYGGLAALNGDKRNRDAQYAGAQFRFLSEALRFFKESFPCQ